MSECSFKVLPYLRRSVSHFLRFRSIIGKTLEDTFGCRTPFHHCATLLEGILDFMYSSTEHQETMGALLPSIISGLVAAVEVEEGTEAFSIEVSMVSDSFMPFPAKHSPAGLLYGVLPSCYIILIDNGAFGAQLEQGLGHTLSK